MKNNAESSEHLDISTESGGEGKARFSHDSFWKDFVSGYFYPLLMRALPELYRDAYTGAKPAFLDKEFTDVLKTADPEAHKSPRFADLLTDVPLRDGSSKWVLCHFEVQSSSGGGDLSERMNLYRCLIYGHYRREPAAVAIITDSRPRGEPSCYSHSRYGTRAVYEYNNLVLSELDDDELTSSENPVDVFLYAAKHALRSRKEIQKYNYLRTGVR